jgi:hypothetical protein
MLLFFGQLCKGNTMHTNFISNSLEFYDCPTNWEASTNFWTISNNQSTQEGLCEKSLLEKSVSMLWFR